VSLPLRDHPPGTEQSAHLDLALMERIAARDAAAVGELYDRHSRLLYGLIVRILGQRSDAEEVLQEVFMTVWNRGHTYEPDLGTPVGWLVRVARNRALDRLRSNVVRRRTAESAAAVPDTFETPETHVAQTEQHRMVVRALEGLPLEQRVLIEQAYFQGFTQSELAERHQLPLGTVKTRIRTGMLTLRQCLTQFPVAQ
jgi:RNA polymerase sigma-70 factor, ECF subfamily